MLVGWELSCSEHLCIVYNKQPFYLNKPNMATAFSRVEFTRFHALQTILGNGCVMCYVFLQCGWLFQHTDFNPIILNFMHVYIVHWIWFISIKAGKQMPSQARLLAKSIFIYMFVWAWASDSSRYIFYSAFFIWQFCKYVYIFLVDERNSGPTTKPFILTADQLPVSVGRLAEKRLTASLKINFRRVRNQSYFVQNGAFDI